LTAVSAIVFFLGLLFGFQRPSRLLPPRLSATVLLLLGCTPFNLGGRLLYFESAFLSSGRCRSVSPLRLVGSQHRAGALCFFLLRRGAELTSFPRLVSTRFVDSFFRLVPASSPARHPPFRGEAASTTTALGVNFARRLSISSFTSLVRSLWPPLRPRFPVRGGAASITAALGVNRLRRLSFFPPTPLRHRCDGCFVEGSRLLPPPR
jgi:hypothetical protein